MVGIRIRAILARLAALLTYSPSEYPGGDIGDQKGGERGKRVHESSVDGNYSHQTDKCYIPK
jgi:hypothetical protein